MTAPATLDDFLNLVQRSGLVPPPRLDTFLRGLAPKPSEPRRLAERAIADGLLTYFQAEQLLQGKWKGFTIGKYKVLERIGFGGMGQVYLCEHERMKRRVAIKVLPAATANEPGTLERFEREARLAASLDHRNICRAYDLDHDEASRIHFLVMEFIDGPTLHDLVRVNGPLPLARAAFYIREAALGIQHAHEAGLVHRDVKPSNILVDRGGTVKLLDLGLGRRRDDDLDQLTRQFDGNNVLGTADYVAPEQTRDSHSVDIRADIYGLGATFYFCLAGRPPFADGTPAQKLLWHQSRAPDPIARLRPDVSLGVVAVIEKMMAKDPARRFQTPAEVAAALAPWTQTPVAPPRADELPTLSPAAESAGSPPPPPSGQPVSPPKSAAVYTGPTPNPFATPAPATFPIYTPLPPKRPWSGGGTMTTVVVLAGIALGVLGGWWLTNPRVPFKPVELPKPTSRK